MKKIKPNFITDYNLFIKSILINKSILKNQIRRKLIQGLVSLGYINKKIPTDEIIGLLYKIKNKLLKEIERQKSKKKIKKKTIIINNDKIFERIIIKDQKNHNISFHTPKNINTKKSTKLKTQIQKKENILIDKKRNVYTEYKYKEGDLLKYINSDNIYYIFNELEKVLK